MPYKGYHKSKKKSERVTYLITTSNTLIHIFLVFMREVHGHAEPFCDEAELDPELIGKADSG